MPDARPQMLVVRYVREVDGHLAGEKAPVLKPLAIALASRGDARVVGDHGRTCRMLKRQERLERRQAEAPPPGTAA